VLAGRHRVRSTAVRRRRILGVAGLAGAFVLAGCAAPGYNPSRIESELIRAGTTPAQAACVTKGLTDTFDRTQLGSHSAPSANRPQPKPSDPPGTDYRSEYEKTRAILQSCGVKLPLLPLPS
jgi:hypothetical protein